MQRRALIRNALALLATASMRPALADADRPMAVPAPPAAAQMQIEVRRSSGKAYPVFTVEARLTVNAPQRRAWRVLTDYDRLAAFVPDLTASRLVARDGHECIVSQEGVGQFLFIKQQIHLLVRVVETPFSAIGTTLVKGNMHEYSADWTLSEIDAATTQIHYDATIAPKFYVPSLFGAALMKSDLRAMLAAVAKEMESGTTAGMKKTGPMTGFR